MIVVVGYSHLILHFESLEMQSYKFNFKKQIGPREMKVKFIY